MWIALIDLSIIVISVDPCDNDFIAKKYKLFVLYCLLLMLLHKLFLSWKVHRTTFLRRQKNQDVNIFWFS